MKTFASSALSFFLAAAILSAQANIPKEPVKFPAGKSEAVIKGSIKGDKTIDYVLSAGAGQKVDITLKASNSSTYFNVLPQGSEAAIFIGSSDGSHYAGTLTQKGDYSIRVYLMRNAARRGAVSNYTITFRLAN